MGEYGHLGTGIMPEQDPGGCMGEYGHLCSGTMPGIMPRRDAG